MMEVVAAVETAAVLLGAAGAGVALFVGTGMLCTAGMLYSTRGLRRSAMGRGALVIRTPSPPPVPVPAFKDADEQAFVLPTATLPGLSELGRFNCKARSR